MENFLQNRPSLATATSYTLEPPVQPGFQPFLRPRSSDEIEKASNVAAPPAPSNRPANEPELELIEGEGCIKRIVITCTCCKRIELECEY